MLIPPSLDHRPSDETDRATILLHGRGRPPGEMRDLAGRIGMLDWRGVFPAVEGSSWYPLPFASPVQDNEPALSDAIDRIATEVARLEDEGIVDGRIVLGGFSQGACVVAEFLARIEMRPMAVILFSGALPGPPDRQAPARPHLAGVPALLTGSRADPFMPPARVTATAKWLEASGARVQVVLSDEGAHAVEDRDVEAAAAFVTALERL